MSTADRKNEAEIRKHQKMLDKFGTKIHPVRIIAYAILYFIAWNYRDFLRNHFMLIVMVILTVASILSIIGVFLLRKYTDVYVDAPERKATCGEVGYITVSVKNVSILVSYDMNIKLMAENEFYKNKSGTIISLPVRARDTYVHKIPVKYTMNGLYKYDIPSVTFRDMLGFISLKKNMDISKEVYVYPSGYTHTDISLTDMSKGMSESEETVKKGHDFSDVSDVREYIPGDKLMSIHWKLSAKRDILMVKDRVAMSDQQMIILVELSGTDEIVDEVLNLTYNICRGMIRDQIFVRLMWWSEANFGFEERHLINLEDLENAYSDMYFEQIYADSSKTSSYMSSIHPEMKAYVRVGFSNGKIDAEVVEL